VPNAPAELTRKASRLARQSVDETANVTPVLWFHPNLRPAAGTMTECFGASRLQDMLESNDHP
jgi:hypothetical protein